jgi:anion-transporting  ArsA/GET3 family ATPase
MKRVFCDCCKREFNPSFRVGKTNGSLIAIEIGKVTLSVEAKVIGVFTDGPPSLADVCVECKIKAIVKAIND